jgi:hypothetical protein
MQPNSLGRIEQVPLRHFWSHEAHTFTTWLAQPENLELLSEALDITLEFEDSEVSVGSFHADIVARDINTDIRVIIENQLERTDHDHLGKTLTYASGLDAGVIVWIAKEFRDEHRRALDYLNERCAPNLRFYGLEIRLLRIDDSRPAPQFKLVSSPNDFASTVRRVGEQQLTERENLYLQFWTDFQDFCNTQGTTLPDLRKPAARPYYRFRSGRTRFRFILSISVQPKRLGCQLRIVRPDAFLAEEQLRQQRDQIEVATGPLVWQIKSPQDVMIGSFLEGVDVSSRSSWPQAMAWLKERAEILYATFSPRIINLELGDPNLDILSDESNEGVDPVELQNPT